MANESKPVVIMGAGLSGLAASIILAKGGRKVIIHDIRENSGARFDGDFQGLENWTTGTDFFDELSQEAAPINKNSVAGMAILWGRVIQDRIGLFCMR